MANYPNSAPSFATRNQGDVINASHINSLQDEVAAIGGGLISGTAPLSSSNSTVVNLSVSNHSTVAGNMSIGGGLNVTGAILTAGAMMSSGLVAAGSPVYSATLSPAALSTGDTADYNPTGLSGTYAVYVTAAGGGSTLSGLVSQGGGAFRLLIALSNPVGLKNEGLGSAAANRVLTRSGSDTVIGSGAAMQLWYDAGVSRWRQL